MVISSIQQEFNSTHQIPRLELTASSIAPPMPSTIAATIEPTTAPSIAEQLNITQTNYDTILSHRETILEMSDCINALQMLASRLGLSAQTNIFHGSSVPTEGRERIEIPRGIAPDNVLNTLLFIVREEETGGNVEPIQYNYDNEEPQYHEDLGINDEHPLPSGFSLGQICSSDDEDSDDEDSDEDDSDDEDSYDEDSDDEDSDEEEQPENRDYAATINYNVTPPPPPQTTPEIYSENDLRLLLEHCNVIRQALDNNADGAVCQDAHPSIHADRVDGTVDIEPQQSLLDGSLFRENIDVEGSNQDLIDQVWAELDH